MGFKSEFKGLIILLKNHVLRTELDKYRVCINYRRISLRRNLSRKCYKILKFVSITHRESDKWNGPRVTTAIGNVTQDILERVLAGMGV
jgi:hypothetical protein